MLIKRLLLILWTVVPLLSGAATLDDFAANPCKSGGCLYAYPYPAEPLPALTPAPEGYEPFYIDHYGRHGSRWLIEPGDYVKPVRLLERLDSANLLTALGKRTLTDLRRWQEQSEKRLGELTDIGAEQHQGIAARMFRNFPQVFGGRDKTVRARSSVVIRCILSMIAETSTLKACNPGLNILTDASQADMKTIAHGSAQEKLGKLKEEARKQIPPGLYHVDWPTFSKQLMLDNDLLSDHEKSYLMHLLRQVAVSLQNHKTDYSLFQLFTTDDLFSMWANDNIHTYLSFGNSPQARNMMPYAQAHLLREMIATADDVIAHGGRVADLRFGHDVVLITLATLMELDHFNVSLDNLADVAEQWRNYDIFPMACNIQMVFYRPVGGAAGDVLVKVLINEHEAQLPVGQDTAPYCRWADLKHYYENKLELMDKEYEKL